MAAALAGQPGALGAQWLCAAMRRHMHAGQHRHPPTCRPAHAHKLMCCPHRPVVARAISAGEYIKLEALLVKVGSRRGGGAQCVKEEPGWKAGQCVREEPGWQREGHDASPSAAFISPHASTAGTPHYNAVHWTPRHRCSSHTLPLS